MPEDLEHSENNYILVPEPIYLKDHADMLAMNTTDNKIIQQLDSSATKRISWVRISHLVQFLF